MVAASGAAALGLHAVTLPRRHADGIAPVFALYRSVRLSLPGTGPVGFVPTTPDPTASAEMRFVVQYALAPLVVVDDVSTAPVVITGPAAPAAIDGELGRSGLVLERVMAGGVRVYRRP
jgi:hypothetical protein